MINKLIKIANSLDAKGLTKEADATDDVLSSILELLGDGEVALEIEIGGYHDEDGDLEEEAEEEVNKLTEEIYSILESHDIDKDSDLANDLVSWCEKHEHEEIRSGGESEEMMEAEEKALEE